MENAPAPAPSAPALSSPGLTEARQLVAAFLASAEVQQLAKNTQATYRAGLAQFVEWLGQETGRTPVTGEVLAAWRNELAASGAAVNTVNARITGLRRFWTWCEAVHGVSNPARFLKNLKSRREFRRAPLDATQARSVLKQPAVKAKAVRKRDTTPAESLRQSRDSALLALLATTGLRVAAVAGATLADVEASRYGVRVLRYKRKGGTEKDAEVVVSAEVWQLLTTYLTRRAAIEGGEVAATAPLFASTSNRSAGAALSPRSVSAIVKEALKAAGLDASCYSAHSLRHTAATLALAGGASMETVQLMLSHANVNTTHLYAKEAIYAKRMADAPEVATGRRLLG